MADNTLPPLPPGFELETEPMPTAAGVPPLPPGFVLEEDEPGLEIDIVGGPVGPAPTAQEMAELRGQRNPSNDSDFGRMVSGQPKQDSSFGRDVKMGLRSAIQGTGGLVGALGGDAFNYYLVPGEQPTYREAAGNIADRLGLPTPQTSKERVMGDVGEALTGTGLTMGVGGVLNAGRSAVSTAAPAARQILGNFLTAQPKLQMVSTATGAGAAGATRESGGSQGEQLAAGLIGGLSPGVVSTATGAATRGAVRGASGAQMQQNIGNFAALGATPSVGQAAQNARTQGLESLLAGGPTSSGVMGRFADQQANNIGAGLQKTADDFSRNASAERAGRAIERGAKTLKGNTSAVKRALYWQADRLIPETTPAPLSNTWQTVVKLTTPDPGATATTGALVQPTIAKMRQNLEADVAAGGGQLTYSALKRIRSDIGEAIDNSSPLVPSADIRELNQLYRALSRDMEGVAQSLGPEAVKAARRANNYTRAAADRLEQVERVIDKNGGPEKVFDAAMSGTRDGGTTLRAVMQSLPKEGQQAVTAAVIKRMGLANPGAQDAAGDVFSAATFMTNWNKVSSEAKRALFDRYGPGFSRDMDRLASVANNIKQGSKVFANPSGTANRAAAISYGLSLGGSIAQAFFTGNLVLPAATISGGVLTNWLARKMTNPDFVGWLARSTDMPVGSATAQFNALRAIGERKNDPELVEIADVLEGKKAPNESGDANN